MTMIECGSERDRGDDPIVRVRARAERCGSNAAAKERGWNDAEAGGERDGRAAETLHDVDVGPSGQDPLYLEGIEAVLSSSASVIGRAARGDAEIDRKAQPEAALDQDVQPVHCRRQPAPRRAGQRRDHPAERLSELPKAGTNSTPRGDAAAPCHRTETSLIWPVPSGSLGSANSLRTVNRPCEIRP